MNENWSLIFKKNFLKITFTFLIVVLFIYVLFPFFKYIVLGAILAMALSPILDYFMLKKGFSRTKSLALLTATISFLILLPVSFFLIRGSRIISGIIEQTNFTNLIQKINYFIDGYITHLATMFNLDQNFIETKINSLLNFLGNYLSNNLGNLITELPNIFLMGFITLLSLYFFLSQKEKCKQLFDHYFYFSNKNSERFINTLKACCREIFITNIITGIIQATIVSLGALFFNVGDFFFIFLITFFVSFIPIIGAAPVAVILSFFCFLESHISAGTALIVLSLIVGISDNIVRPYLSSKGNVETNPIIDLIAIMGGVTLFGLPGLFIGPLIVSVFFGVLPIILDEYFPQN